MIFLTKVIDKPTLVTDGELGGAYAWKFDMQLLLTVLQPPYDDNSSFQNAELVSVIVQRQPVLQSTDGVGIVQLLIKSASGSSSPNNQQ